MSEGKIELPNETTSTEGKHLLTERDDRCSGTRPQPEARCRSNYRTSESGRFRSKNPGIRVSLWSHRSAHFSSSTMGQIRDARYAWWSARANLAGRTDGLAGRESAGEPGQIATETADLTSELKRGLSFVRKNSRVQKKNKVA